MPHILIIDDSPEIRQLLRVILEEAGHQVSEAGDGEDGLRVFRAEPADVVFCDLFMPVREGLETIRDLRRDWPEVKIVAMSGGSPRIHHDFLLVASRIGAEATLPKPFGPGDVLRALRRVLGEK